MDADTYREALKRLHLSQVGAARLFAVNPRTSRRWALGEQNVPRAVEIALGLLLTLDQRERTRRLQAAKKGEGK